MKYRITGLLLLLSVSLLSGCIELGRSWSDTTETRLVDFYKEPCDDDANTLCFRVREETGDSWELLDEDVSFDGFTDYQWGYRYEVEVVVSHDDDGDPTGYTFSQVVTQESITDAERSISMNLYSDTGILYAEDDSTWSLGGDISFACGDSCSDLTTAVTNGQVLELEFSATDGVLTLESFICSADEDDFASVCSGESSASWRVAWFQSDCGLADAHMCLLYKVNSSDDYELLKLADGITDFTPVWGEQADIDVTKTVSNGGNITAVVLDTDDSSPDDRTGSSYPFYMIVRGSELDSSSNGLITLYDGAPDLDCSSYNLCSRINGYIDDEQWMLIYGYYDGDVVVRTVVCHSDDIDSFRSCVDDEDDVNWGI
ncbi:hypothetical protein [Parathalassolituus penaei]|uniref:DUF4377 domain-containing protein n=1 Tax=Parathalassolituus penaei TaxID=2997323 RepID=A0A9X3IUN5_9GAMM|nr:hypothetical protein [Parathalassolituus penaei]MCY0967134.1 hypothetical protein [Parathalassolituus penaei]